MSTTYPTPAEKLVLAARCDRRAADNDLSARYAAESAERARRDGRDIAEVYERTAALCRTMADGARKQARIYRAEVAAEVDRAKAGDCIAVLRTDPALLQAT